MSQMWEPPQPTDGPGRHSRISGPQNIRNEAERFDARGLADVRAAEAAREHHEGLSARLVASGNTVRELIEELRHRDMPPRESLRPLAAAFSRHCAATESTARRVLDERGGAGRDAARQDREEGERFHRQLADLVAHEPPAGTYHVMAGGILADIDQYLLHQQRELIPAIDRELTPAESRRLAGAFSA